MTCPSVGIFLKHLCSPIILVPNQRNSLSRISSPRFRRFTFQRPHWHFKMNSTDSSVADPYLQEFVLDSFANATIKPEIICPNTVGDVNDDAASTAAPTPSSASTVVGLPEDDLLLRHPSPDSVIMPHSQIPHRLPPMSLLHSQASPPPHLLTPPESQDDYYPTLHHHHPIISSSLMKNCNLIIPGNLPDSPPINSPPLPAIYHHLEHHHIPPQYPPLPALHHLHQPPGDVAEDMLWLSQSADLPPRQEPLDLRPHNGDSIQNWNMLQQHTSVITGRRIYQAGLFHQETSLGQYPTGQLPTISPLLTNSSTSPSASSTSSLSLLTTTTKALIAHNGLESQARGADSRVNAGSRSSRGRARPAAAAKMASINAGSNNSGRDRGQSSEVKFEDDLLLKINVRDLNVKLKGTTKDHQTKTKQRRRTLKNRIYAQNCRNKRNEQKSNLEKEKIQIQQEMMMTQKELQRSQNEVARERQMNDAWRIENGKLRNEIELLRQKLREYEARSANATCRCSTANLATNLSVTSSVGEY